MRKNIITVMLALLTGTAFASPIDGDSIYRPLYQEQIPDQLSPEYLDYAVESAGWKSNWFVGVRGGMSAFIGTPTGCGDLTDRIQPALSIELGKWFTPHIGTRLAFQGLHLKDTELERRPFESYRLDLLFNLNNAWKKSETGVAKWSVIPYFGAGVVNSNDFKKTSFALSYGISVGYSVTQRLRASVELGGISALQDFDGLGRRQRFGDNFATLTAGVSYTIGRAGWKRIIDPMPYVYQNDWLIDYTDRLRDRNAELEREKIMRIDGWLDSKKESKPYPKNNYSGLNSLRARLNGGHLMEAYSEPVEFNWQPSEGECIGAPVNFFFQLGTAEFTNNSQKVNLMELAKVITRHNLRAVITGAADSSTGTPDSNMGLGMERAKVTGAVLMRLGVAAENIEYRSEGGVSKYSPIEANRYTRVELFEK